MTTTSNPAPKIAVGIVVVLLLIGAASFIGVQIVSNLTRPEKRGKPVLNDAVSASSAPLADVGSLAVEKGGTPPPVTPPRRIENRPPPVITFKAPPLPEPVALPFSGAVNIPLSVQPTSPLTSSWNPADQNLLLAEKPAEIVTPPQEEKLLYGKIPLARKPVWFAIAPPKVRGQTATLYVDRNRDGDFTNDTPSGYPGSGTWRTGARMELDIERDNGSSFSHHIWLWTTLGNAEARGPQRFHFYANSHKRGSFRLPSGKVVQVLANDPGNSGAYESKKVLLDWNGNEKAEAPEWLSVGTDSGHAGTVVRLVSIAPYADAITLEVNPIGAEKADVVEQLSREPLEGNLPLELGADINGKAVRAESYRGKVVLVDFWATWCAPCVREMPNVRAAYDKHHASGFEIIGVSLDSDLERMKQFTEVQNMPWVQICDRQGWKSPVVQRWRVEGIPATFLIGKDGKIARVGLTGNALLTAIEKELSK